jgi:hypothetical protein
MVTSHLPLTMLPSSAEKITNRYGTLASKENVPVSYGP